MTTHKEPTYKAHEKLTDLYNEIGKAVSDVKARETAEVIRPNFSHEANHTVLGFGPLAANAIKQAAEETAKRAMAAGEEAVARAHQFMEDCKAFADAVKTEAELRADAVHLFGEQMQSMAQNLTATRDLMFPPPPAEEPPQAAS